MPDLIQCWCKLNTVSPESVDYVAEDGAVCCCKRSCWLAYLALSKEGADEQLELAI